MLSRVERQTEARSERKKESASSAPLDSGLLATLKTERTRLARQEGVPPYIIFSNAALADMAARAPRTPEEFLDGVLELVKGITNEIRRIQRPEE